MEAILIIHIKSVHDGMKYPCDQCGHQFSVLQYFDLNIGVSNIGVAALVHQVFAVLVEVETLPPVQDPETVPQTLTHLQRQMLNVFESFC